METGSSISRSAEETAKQFQAYLRKYENDEKLVILKAVDEPGSKLGDNYTSVIIRTKLVGTRGDGSPYAKSFMTKTLSEERPAATFLGLSNLFRNEAHVYKKILPILGPFGPDCIYFDEKNIIMEDLAEKGYANCDRRDLLDLEHATVVLKELAKFHALALAIKIKDPQKFDGMAASLKETIYTDNPPNTHMETCARMSMKAMVQNLEMLEPRTRELQEIIDYLNDNADKIYDIFTRMFNGPKEKYYSICHGDPWVNNFLYLHDKNGKVANLKLVDYQISRHFSVASDIHYLMYTSVQSSLIEKSYESLIKIYHKKFLDELRRLQVNNKILAELSPEWLEAELQACKLYGLVTGSWIIHAVLAEDKDVEEFEKFDLQNMENFDLSKITMSKKKLDRIKCITLHYHRRYYLGIINDDIEPLSITEKF